MRLVDFLIVAAPCALLLGCEEVDHAGEVGYPVSPVSMDSVARMLSALPLGAEHYSEVHDAVSSSSGNGYDEEYMMKDLFSSPGAGVGDTEETKSLASKAYSKPLRELIREHYAAATKASGGGRDDAMKYLEELEKSDIQIYWPYSDNWDGVSAPIITFDPENGAESNVGYRMVPSQDGGCEVEDVIVDEEMAAMSPVWVVNRNDDSGYASLEMLRRKDPEWETGGGTVIIKPSLAVCEASQKTASSDFKTLVLKDFTMLRNYDSWFAGASEFFVKCGRIEDFTASTEAELKLYSPKISDFMIVVKRKQMGVRIPFNAILVSQWTDQTESMALMVVEDDGGTRTEWKCSAVVKIKSKSYGFDISIPFNTRDDIVWRGQLSGKYLEKYDGTSSRFGDVEMTFEFQ